MVRSALLAAPLLGALLLGLASPAFAGDEDVKAVAQGNSAFALDLYGRLREKPGNLFFSPFSVSAALAMTMAGARGNTETEMAKVLHQGLARDRVHPALGALIRDLNGRKVEDGGRDAGKQAFELVLANSLFGQKGFAFLPEFVAGNRKAYDAGFSELDFKGYPEKSRLAVNAWVEEKTRKRVKDILAPGAVTPDTRLALANALYFIAPWEHAFEPEATKDGVFRPAEGEPVKVPFMRRMETYRFTDGGAFDVLVLPYRGGELAMAVILPKAADGLPAVEAALEPGAFWAVLRAAKWMDVDVAIPKFRIESSFDLKEPLLAMGMKDAFSETKADFSGMTGKKDLFLGLVVHKSFVAVDEKGTEAAAATVALMELKGIPQKEKEFVADHPFLFAIADLKTETVLFLGRVANPAK
jgi:serpin B